MPVNKPYRVTRNPQPGGRAFVRIRRAWVCEYSDGKKGYAQYQEVLVRVGRKYQWEAMPWDKENVR